MGPSVYGGTGRLPLLSSFFANHLRSQETRYILSAYSNNSFKGEPVSKLLSRFLKKIDMELLRLILPPSAG